LAGSWFELTRFDNYLISFSAIHAAFCQSLASGGVVDQFNLSEEIAARYLLCL
jgi:hypothetical protein